jgi:alkylhydroperoxidase/carboxymuconolactone decarboxylase family protein YurZ
MSLAQTQDTLTHDPAVLQQHAAAGDLFAMAKLYKQLQAQKAQQMQAGLAQQMQPSVKAQLQASAQQAPQGVAPEQQPEQSGIAMAAGGIVRHFDGGGQVGEDEYGYLPDEGIMGRFARRFAASNFRSAADNAPPVPFTDPASARVAQEYPELIAQLRAKTTDPKAPWPTTRAPTADDLSAKLGGRPATNGIAAGATMTRASAQSGPSGYRGSATPARNDSAPDDAEETYRDRADALAAKLDPLYAKQRAAFVGQTDTENQRYAGLKDAKNLSLADQMTVFGQKLSNAAHGHGRDHGIADLAQYGATDTAQRQQAKLDASAAEAKHQIALQGINAGATDAEIKQAMAQYNLVNGAALADDKSEINWYKAEAEKAAAAAKAAKGAKGAAAAKGVMTPAQYGTQVVKYVNAAMSRGLSHEEALAEAKTVVPAIGTPATIQAGSVPAAAGDSFKVIGSRPSQ